MHLAESISHVVNTDVRLILRAREVSARQDRTVHGSTRSLPTALHARHVKHVNALRCVHHAQGMQRMRERRCENSTSGDGGLEVRQER